MIISNHMIRPLLSTLYMRLATAGRSSFVSRFRFGLLGQTQLDDIITARYLRPSARQREE